jgi:co-chaperonin GroES (HSP10)
MIKPTKGFLLTEPIKLKEREDTTKSGIILPKPKKEREDLIVCKATILEVGEGTAYKKGEVIYYNYFSGNTILLPSKDALGKDDRELHLVWSEDVLAWEK